jgi:hypothetical protein
MFISVKRLVTVKVTKCVVMVGGMIVDVVPMIELTAEIDEVTIICEVEKRVSNPIRSINDMLASMSTSDMSPTPLYSSANSRCDLCGREIEDYMDGEMFTPAMFKNRMGALI